MLILTEKPSVAAAFAAALRVSRNGSYWENNNNCIVNALGHLLEPFDPEDYNPSYKKWNIDDLPIMPTDFKYKAVEKTFDQLKIIKKCFDKHFNDVLLLATDAEREGELIGAEILEFVGFKNYDKALRFWVSEALTQDVILKGIKNAKPLSDYASYRYQGYARQQADWLTGINFTRFVSLHSTKLLTVGRVQSAVLGAVYDRDKSISAFNTKEFYELNAYLGQSVTFGIKLVNPTNFDFPFRFDADDPLFLEVNKMKDTLKNGKITHLEKEKKTVYPPSLYNLTALQKDANKRFSYTPEQTLSIAQSLYEKHKCLSYPRTPSQVMGDDNVNLVQTIHKKLNAEYRNTAWKVLIEGADNSLISPENKRVFNSDKLQDHHALIPLAPLPSSHSEEEYNIYSLVVERFFTVFKSPYIYNSINIDVDISGYLFRGNGVEVLDNGWKTEKEEDEEETENFSGIAEGMTFPVSSIMPEQKFTEPKKHYTFATILQLMENPRSEENSRLSGLGTPATRGNILQKLLDRKYLALKGKSLLITEDGSFLIDNLRKNPDLANFISIPETTRWEEVLHQNTDLFLDEVKGFVQTTIKNTSVKIEKYENAKENFGSCPLCGNLIYKGKNNFYCGGYKEGCKFVIWFKMIGASITHSDVKLLLTGKKTPVKKCTGKNGKKFEVFFKLDNGEVKYFFK